MLIMKTVFVVLHPLYDCPRPCKLTDSCYTHSSSVVSSLIAHRVTLLAGFYLRQMCTMHLQGCWQRQ